jgi:hypothetical protein
LEVGRTYSAYEEAGKCMYSFKVEYLKGIGYMEADIKVDLKYDTVMWTGIDCSRVVRFCDPSGL